MSGDNVRSSIDSSQRKVCVIIGRGSSGQVIVTLKKGGYCETEREEASDLTEVPTHNASSGDRYALNGRTQRGVHTGPDTSSSAPGNMQSENVFRKVGSGNCSR